jgi:hypothetical protein
MHDAIAFDRWILVRGTRVNSLVGFEAGSLHAHETTFTTMQPGKHIAPRFVKLAYAFLDVTPRHVSCRDVSVVWDVYVPIFGNLRIVAGHVATNESCFTLESMWVVGL